MIRTRFAPSPTGYMHIGNLRTALYAWLLARRHGGRFILRIEDTDRKRNVEGAIDLILDSLRQAGLDYDEGPDKGGPYGPYLQSQRLEIYRDHAERLLALGGAYRCFCPPTPDAEPDADEDEGSAAEAAAAPPTRAEDPCRSLDPAASARRAAAGEPHVVRQRIPREGQTSFEDHVFGRITIDNAQLDDQVLLKSDGYPTYNFANVVDDHLMAITHVVRGVEYLSSTPKYNLLYRSFGWEIPHYIHLPHIRHESGRKLSKRAGDASFQDLLAMGYVPEAIVNYIALLGWNPGDEREVLTREELIAAFDIDRINKSAASFSFAKLDWFNGEHLRRMDPAAFDRLARSYYPPEVLQRCDAAVVSAMIRPRVVRLTEIPAMVRFLIELPEYPLDLFVHAKSKSTIESSRRVLEAMLPRLQAVEAWTHDALMGTLTAWAQEAGLKTATVMWPVRIALSGQAVTPGGAIEIALALGRDETLRRVEAALARLRAASGG